MKTNRILTLVNATSVAGLAAVSAASGSPELGTALANFNRDFVKNSDSTLFLNNVPQLIDGPATGLSIALADPKNERYVDQLIKNHADAIDRITVDSLTEQVRIAMSKKTFAAAA